MAAIEFDGLSKAYGDFFAVEDVTFEVEEGEIFGYLGANGAGKSTTIRVLLGLLSPTDGGARLLGHDVTDESELVAAKRRVGYLPDNLAFDERATGHEILDLHADIKGGSRTDELVELLDPPLEKQVREFSHGNVKKLGLVTTFMHDPDLVVLDEPTSGIDPLMKQRFGEFLRAERDDGLSVFFSSHILGEVRRLCDRVGIIRDGTLVTVEPVEVLLNRSGKVVRIVTERGVDRERFEQFEGVEDLGAARATRLADTDDTTADAFREFTFTYSGDVDDLLAVVSDIPLLDLEIEEAPLEDVFLRFYSENGDETSSSRGGTDGSRGGTDDSRGGTDDSRGGSNR